MSRHRSDDVVSAAPPALVEALGLLLRVRIFVREDQGRLDTWKAEWLAAASQDVIDGRLLPGPGPLYAALNAAIAERASELMGGEPVDPGQDVAAGLAEEDALRVALHLAAASALREARLRLPAASALLDALLALPATALPTEVIARLSDVAGLRFRVTSASAAEVDGEIQARLEALASAVGLQGSEAEEGEPAAWLLGRIARIREAGRRR